jgi:hypothetical protein
VTACYHPHAISEELLSIWGFVERGCPNDWPYPIQRPLQLLPRLPWDVVLAAAGRLQALVQLGPESLQQQGLSLSAGDLASLTDGQPVNRILAAASCLPLAWDTTLEQHDGGAHGDAEFLLRCHEEYLRPWCAMEGDRQEALWKRRARIHIMETVRGSLDSRAARPAAAQRAVKPDTPQQRWEASLAELSARVLGLQARLGLLTMPTTLEEDLALEGAALAGGFASWTPKKVARLLGRREEGDWEQLRDTEKALGALQTEVRRLIIDTAALSGKACDSSSSHDEMQLLQAELAKWESAVDEHSRQQQQAPRRRKRIDRLRQLVKGASSSDAAAPAAARAAGVDPCVLLAIQARLQQKMLIHMFGLLCDGIAAELRAKLG